MADGWWSKRPKQLLQRYLEVKWSSKITRLDTHFSGLINSNVHVYLEADVATIESIIAKGNFVKDSDQSNLQRTSDLSFDGVPDALSVPLLYYSKDEWPLREYLATTPEGERLWYVAYDRK